MNSRAFAKCLQSDESGSLIPVNKGVILQNCDRIGCSEIDDVRLWFPK